jgi:NADPH:quinone reductase-like Zn-dependent oxidoreductase
MSSRAVRIDRPGGPDELAIREMSEPAPGEGQVLVRTVASTHNPVDRNMRTNKTKATLTYPLTPGWDVAGVVVESNVGAYKAGDRVIAVMNAIDSGMGAWADLVALNVGQLTHAPASVSLSEAATIPLAGLTGLQCWNSLTLAPGERLLVAGAAGAVGGFVVQLAANAGIQVDGLVSRASHVNHAKSLGAGFVTDDPAALPAMTYNVMVDTAALPSKGVDVREFVTEEAQYVRTTHSESKVPSDRWILHVPKAEDLGHLVKLIEAGELTLRVAARYPLREIQDACERAEAGGLTGKVVLEF